MDEVTGRGDHLSVRADLSDLGDAILWAKTNDKECEKIVSNARSLYERFIAQDGQLDYLQVMCWEVAARFSSRGATADDGHDAAVLAPGLAEPPGFSGDWFSESNADYCANGLGPLTRAPAPFARDLASEICGCPSCLVKKASVDALHATGQREAASVAAKAATAADTLRAAVDRRNAIVAAAARAPVPVFAFKDLTKARAAAERAAAAAAVRKSAESLGAGAGSGAGAGIRR